MRLNPGGLVLVVLGVLLLLSNLGLLDWTALWQFWPLILVAVGVLMLIRRD